LSLAAGPRGSSRGRAGRRRARAQPREAARGDPGLPDRERRDVLRPLHTRDRDGWLGPPACASRARHPGGGERVALRRWKAAGSRRRHDPVHRAHDRSGRGCARRRCRRDHRLASNGGRAMTTVTGAPVQRAKRASQTIPDSGADTHGPALEPLLFELARPGRSGRHVRAEKTGDVPAKFARKTPLRLPEFTALLMFKAYHQKRGDAATRRRIIVPDSAHGTNPASAAMCGYEVTTVKSDARGNVDLEALKSALGPDVAGFMLTNPNTIGLFEERVREVCDAVHAVGALVYGDGANM